MNVIHADINLDNCGKFGEEWKLMNTTGLTTAGHTIQKSRLGMSLPPEAVEIDRSMRVRFKNTIVASVALDVWAFGKIMYEALVGHRLINLDENLGLQENQESLFSLAKWGDKDIERVIKDLAIQDVNATGADLISQCLSSNARDRPSSMTEVLQHPFWYIARRKSRKPKVRRAFPRSSDQYFSMSQSPSTSSVTSLSTYGMGRVVSSSSISTNQIETDVGEI